MYNKFSSTKSGIYSPGFRYFYWQYYRDNKAKRNSLFRTSYGYSHHEENKGYELRQWFIKKRYNNLKEEILKKFSKIEFDTTKWKAQKKMSTNVPEIKNIKCSSAIWENIYGIKKGSTLSLQHVMAILFYTNFSKQCNEFRATYRKNRDNEKDYELKKRHREYYHWGKLLREAVECYGIKTAKSEINAFHHGLSETLIFDSTTIYLCAPTSTTADICVAVDIFGRDGIVVTFQNNSAQRYFDCRCWSDFVNEDEKLFVGGLTTFTFRTIRNMKTLENYNPYVNAIAVFHKMIQSQFWSSNPITRKDFKSLDLLIKAETINKKEDSLSLVPEYVLNLWHHFLLQIKQIEIDWGWLTETCRTHPTKKIKGYGYRLIAPLFCTGNFSSLNFTIFVNIFPNLNTIHFKFMRNKRYEKCVSLNETFISNILETIKMINNSKSLSVTFKSINIAEPWDSINKFNNENQELFNQQGWRLMKKNYKHNKCKNSLTIEKL
eukprot:296172_1